MNNKLTPNQQFWNESKESIEKMAEDKELQDIIKRLNHILTKHKYQYNFKWLDRPMIALPSDMYGFQEIFWKVKPDLIIETGIAHGGSTIFWASMMELLGGDGEVVAVDIDIREHNQEEIEKHHLYKRINLIQGSSIDSEIVEKVKEFAKGKKTVMVVLDSNHTHDHVMEEMKAYGGLVTKGSYMIVCDTIVEVVENISYDDRPWDYGNNPYTAVMQYMKENVGDFEIDYDIEKKILLTVAPSGWLVKQ